MLWDIGSLAERQRQIISTQSAATYACTLLLVLKVHESADLSA